MSTFQYYEFQKLDGPLSMKSIEEVGKLSSRAQICGNQAKFIYHYGDFRADPEAILSSYFDSMLYIANWGVKQLSFRLPCDVISPSELSMYACEDIVSFRELDHSLIVTMQYQCEEGFGWIEEDDIAFTLSAMQGLRQALLLRDFRCLYLAWLTYYDHNDPALGDLPIPANMADLSPELSAFADFCEIDMKSLHNRFCTS